MDIHRLTASKVFGVPEESVTPEMRKQGKNINFGNLYKPETQMTKKPNTNFQQKLEAALVQQPEVRPEVRPEVQRDPGCDGPEFCDGTDAEGFPGGDARFGLEHPSLAADFVALCQQVNSSLNLNDLSFFQDNEYQDPYEDDGTLHVVDKQTCYRACFDVSFGQTLSRSHQNRNAQRVLKRLGLEHLYTDRVQR